MTITDIIKNCDSWSTDIEDLGETVKGGRYGVSVYFDTEAEAKAFSEAIRQITVTP